MNKHIHENPELAYEEFIAHDTLTSFMKGIDGWSVVSSAYGMKTAWVATFSLPGPGSVVSFNAEMGMKHCFRKSKLEQAIQY